MNRSLQIRIAALVMFLAIGLGAMGAHGLEPRLVKSGHFDHWKTAALYQLIHGLAMFAVALAGKRERPPACFWFWLGGTILFSGSLYVLCLTDISKLGAITPLGGLAFMIGWAILLVKPGQVLQSD